MPHQITATNTFECENSCGTIIQAGEICYYSILVSGTGLICKGCVENPKRGARHELSS